MHRDTNAPLMIISHPTCLSQSIAKLSAVRIARGQLIVTLHTDGQNVPADIPTLLAIAKTYTRGTHFRIAGWRRARDDTAWKRVQS